MKSWRFWTILFLVAYMALGLIIWRPFPARNGSIVINQTPVPPVPTLNSNIVTQGDVLYQQHCAACHGAELQGASNWKSPLADRSYPPPPHDSSGHTWHHPDALLLDIITNGGDPTSHSKMPAFSDQLDQEQMSAILTFLKSKWGREEREFQWWMTVTRRNGQN